MRYTIQGRLLGLNDMTHQNRFSYGAKKKAETQRCAWATVGRIPQITQPIEIEIWWYEQNEKRDIDNVAAGIKFILDGLVVSGKLPNDTRKWVKGIKHHFPIDKENPRIEIVIRSHSERTSA